jgi:hypothetical protein
MTRDNVLTLIGMAINAEKQAAENREAIREETGVDYTAVYLYAKPKIQVSELNMGRISDALGVVPTVTDRHTNGYHDTYPYELSLDVEGAKVFAICEKLPDWAEAKDVHT